MSRLSFGAHGAESEDQGYYRVVANNIFRTTEKTVYLNVQWKPEVKMSASHELVFGGNCSVTCSSISNPKSNLSWYQNGSPINKSSYITNVVLEYKISILTKSELKFISVLRSD